MRKREKAGLTVAPLLLRIALGVTFLWAGLGKVIEKETFSSEDAAVLANAGVITPGGAPAGETPSDPAESIEESPGETPEDGGQASAGAFEVIRASQLTGYTAADFPEGHTGLRVQGLVIGLYKASHPGYNEAGERQMAFWPKALGEGKVVSLMAWLVAIGEILCGLGVLFGLLTRLGGFGIGFIMLGAMWLDQIGPAMQSGQATLGVLPAHDVFSHMWGALLWQLLLACAGFSVLLLGAGPLSVDAILFRPKTSEDDGDEGDDDADD